MTDQSDELFLVIDELLGKVRQSKLCSLRVQDQQVAWLQNAGIFDEVEQALQERVLDLAAAAICRGNVAISRAIGCLVGMAVADGLGHHFEFLPVQDSPGEDDPHIEFPCSESRQGEDRGRVYGSFNRFRLKPGQWTDDTSMGLCLADSILISGGYDGTRARIWYWNWWNNGLNNGFRHDHERRQNYRGHSLSVGLGGNISKSLDDVGRLARRGENVPACFESASEDAGNGSLMRLGAVPIRFHHSLELARAVARKSSLATHPGRLAADACDFMAYLVTRAIRREEDEPQTARLWLDKVREDYLGCIHRGEVQARPELVRLVQAAEAEGSTERCWNWRSAELRLRMTAAARGASYNGFPVSLGYFGSFSLDGLAMALHAVYWTDSLDAAIVKVINMAGDSDTTGAICGQIAGAFYGAAALNAAWVADLHRCDRREIELRAIMLYAESRRDGMAGNASSRSTCEFELPARIGAAGVEATPPKQEAEAPPVGAARWRGLALTAAAGALVAAWLLRCAGGWYDGGVWRSGLAAAGAVWGWGGAVRQRLWAGELRSR